MGEQTAFVYTIDIQESPERVWQGLTDPELSSLKTLLETGSSRRTA